MRELLDKYTNKASRFVVLEKTLFHYRDEGEGETILLLHGAFSSLQTFNAWTKELSKYYRVIRLDLAGFGLTGPLPDSDYSINRHLKVIRYFLNLLDVRQCHIAGSSLGGWIAWEFALRHPQRVNKLVLIDSAGFLDLKSIPLPFKMAKAPFAARMVKYIVRRNLLEQFVKQVYYDKSKVTAELVNRYYDLFTREGNAEAFLHFVNGKFKENTEDLETLENHTLILWGENDAWLSVENAHRFHQLIPNSKLIVYPEIGHLPMEENPEESVLDVLDFLESEDQDESETPEIKGIPAGDH